MNLEQCEKRSIIKILAGSHIHGLAVETSDRDEEAIVIEYIEDAFGLKKPFEELIRESPEKDIKYVSLRKWCGLALKGNPNFLLALFAPPESVLYSNAIGAGLRELKDSFISQQSIKSHLGYMTGQKHRMQTGSNGGRGKPRQDKIDEFGYDVKYGMHLIRLAWQGWELASTGRINLPVGEPMRSLLRDIRAGKHTLEEVLQMADDLEADMKREFDSGFLPEHPDYEKVEKWMLDVYAEWWKCDKRHSDMLWMQKAFPKSTIPTIPQLPPEEMVRGVREGVLGLDVAETASPDAELLLGTLQSRTDQGI